MTTEAQLGLVFSSMPCESLSGQKPDGPSLKTSQDYSAASPGETLLPWLEHWLGASLAYQMTDGEMPVLLLAQEGRLSGQLWTRNSSEWRKGAAVCSLSEILETGEVDRRFYLSATACRGILRRAEKRGKSLPPQLMSALDAVAKQHFTPAAD